VAEEAGVPIVEDLPLARALYATVEVEEQIPHEHFEAVAKIIGFIMSAGKGGAAKPAANVRPAAKDRSRPRGLPGQARTRPL
jgi:flagellar biosynthetic protein FlhB